MSNFLCKSETLSLIAEKLADRAAKLGRRHSGDIDFWFKKILKMNRIAADCLDAEKYPREYIQQCGKRPIRPADIVSACRCYEYQVAGIYYNGLDDGKMHILDFENNRTIREIRTLGYNAACFALRAAAPHELMRADDEWWA